MSRVLFIGNSHTYYNDMPFLFRFLTQQGPVSEAQVTMLTQGGKSLEFHKTSEQARFNILYGEYDYVVLQTLQQPFGGAQELIRDASALNQWIKEAGAVPVTYMIWPKKDEPQRHEEFSRAHRASWKAIGGILAPVGDVWRVLRESHPEIELYFEDGRHAGPVGSYLAACTFYAAIYGKSPVGLPCAVSSHGAPVLCLPEQTARIIQQTVEQVVLGEG
ncbi:MAG: hypothetical protein PHD32_02210 [Eubacteriales bacterium]|nr:hypothetical protein [Eubacteriales bacterium]